jgi:hypothetical protein
MEQSRRSARAEFWQQILEEHTKSDLSVLVHRQVESTTSRLTQCERKRSPAPVEESAAWSCIAV